MIKDLLTEKVKDALRAEIGSDAGDVVLEKPQNPDFGDYACNVAMQLAKKLGKKPRDIAAALARRLQADPEGLIAEATVAGPGFLNLRLSPKALGLVLVAISQEGERYGSSHTFTGKKALVEFVSANPTGPLHIGHGRGAVVGDTLARLFSAAGYTVEKEYYVNDGGVQIRTLGKSLWLRHHQDAGRDVAFPEDCYQGAYIGDLVRTPEANTILKRVLGDEQNIPTDDSEIVLALGEFAGNAILSQIMQDLQDTGVTFDRVFFESSLYKDGLVAGALAELKAKGLAYEKDGALWLKSTAFGDDKDRVLVKSGGASTYLAPDIAYHCDKYRRGYDLIVNVWGADHAGYIARVEAAMKGLGLDVGRLKVNFIQMVNLSQGGKQVSMSTRRASYITLQDVLGEVGRDVVRFFFLLRSHNAQLDFDLELAKSQSQDNPVYYVQYAHARICAIFRKAAEQGLSVPKAFTQAQTRFLTMPEEKQLISLLAQFPEVIGIATAEREPHRVTFYTRELAQAFQYYYSQAKHDETYRIVGVDRDRTLARLALLSCLRQVLRNAFAIIGIAAPEEMTRSEGGSS